MGKGAGCFSQMVVYYVTGYSDCLVSVNKFPHLVKPGLEMSSACTDHIKKVVTGQTECPQLIGHN